MAKDDKKIPAQKPGQAVRGDTSLREFISAVKTELQSAVHESSNEIPFFQLYRVDLEVSFALKMGGKSGFNLIVAKADGELEAHQTQKVLLSLRPVAPKPPNNRPPEDDRDDKQDSTSPSSPSLAPMTIRHKYEPHAPLLHITDAEAIVDASVALQFLQSSAVWSRTFNEQPIADNPAIEAIDVGGAIIALYRDFELDDVEGVDDLIHGFERSSNRVVKACSDSLYKYINGASRQEQREEWRNQFAEQRERDNDRMAASTAVVPERGGHDQQPDVEAADEGQADD